MTANESGSPRPGPKPPATGADAWKNQPTNCWPTPANLAKGRNLNAPLDAAYGDEPDNANRWESEGGADDAESQVPRRDDAAQSERADDAGGRATDSRGALSADLDVPERFRDAVGRLDDLPSRPVAEHAESYDSVHRDLHQALDDVERHN